MCFSVIGSPKIHRPTNRCNIIWSYIGNKPSRWWSLMGFGRQNTEYWPPPYEGRRCVHRAALFTTLNVKPWRGGEAKSMAMSLRRSYSGLPWDMTNIIASYMPAKAKTWTCISEGKAIHVNATDPDPPLQPLHPPPKDDGEIQEIL